MAQQKSSGWVVVVFEGEYKQFDGEVAYVKGPFDEMEQAQAWADQSEHCQRDEFQITFIEPRDA